jgi:TonB-dependent starch-binding outer membrane protein SusC
MPGCLTPRTFKSHTFLSLWFRYKRLFETINQGRLVFKIIPFFILFCLSETPSSGQQLVTGRVTDGTGAPLQGVTILVKGTTLGTQTDSGGVYRVLARKGDMLVFSFVGYEATEIKVGDDLRISLSLQKLINNLNEVIVSGYVAQTVKNITGSVAIVKPKDLTAVPAGQVEPMLQGRVAGVNVITQATPGAPTLISIHGYGNFGDVSPLYIIDGTPGNINDLNPDDIQSLVVLKDAGSAAIYGVRGANGVIEVTTRKGRAGNTAVSFENYFGYQVPLTKGYDILNPAESAQATWNAYKNSNQPLNDPQYGSGPTPVLPDYVLAGSQGGLFEGDPATDISLYNISPDQGPLYQIVKANKFGTDVFHALYSPAFSQNYTLTASGGNDKNRYLFSVGYLNQQGTLINTYLKRFTVRVNTEFNLLNNLRIGENLQLSSRELPDYNGPANPGPSSASSATLASPILPLFDIEGNPYSLAPGLGSPVPVTAYENSKFTKQYNWTVLGNAYAELDFAKYFTFRTNFGGTFDYQYYYNYTPRFNLYPQSGTNALTEGSGYDRKWSWQNTIVFNRQIREDNSIKFLLGTEYISSYGRSLYGSRVGFFSDDPIYSYLSNGGVTGQNNGSQAFNSALYSIFSRLDYAFKEKYLLMATLRRDGSSVFGSENRYSYFPSVSGAWRISKEMFAANLSWITELKLRGSWGKLGFDGNTPLNNQYTLYGGSPGTSFYDIGGINTGSVQGFNNTAIGNPKTGWQTDIQTNIGLDGILWNSKLTFSADWYIKKSTGLLFPLSLPFVLGGAAAPYVNVGDVENKGIDLLIGSKGNLSRDLRYEITATFTSYNNEIVKLNDGQDYFDNFVWRNQVGHPISSFYGYKIIGLFNNAEDVLKSPTQEDAAPGRFKYLDANKDGKISDSDRVFTGNPNPKFSLGLNIAFNYKNFDFSTFFYGVFGNDVFNGVRLETDFFPGPGAKSKTLLYDSWTLTHRDAKVSINENVTNFSNEAVPNSYPIESGSYLRNKSMILGYTLNKNTAQKMKMKQLRVYIQVTNLFTFTKYTGLDPESIGTGSAPYFGVDAGNYPNNQKQWLVGLNVGF